jgi:hypothetical protein
MPNSASPPAQSRCEAPAAMPARERVSLKRARHQRAGVGPRERVMKSHYVRVVIVWVIVLAALYAFQQYFT